MSTGETDAIATIRIRAEVARHLAKETKQAAAKASLLEIASSLDAEAERLEQALDHEDREQ